MDLVIPMECLTKPLHQVDLQVSQHLQHKGLPQFAQYAVAKDPPTPTIYILRMFPQ